MVIEDGERIDALAVDFEVAFEVTLPEIVGERAFETVRGLGGGRDWKDALMSSEDVGDGADAW